MAAAIEELVIGIGMDTSNLVAGIRDVMGRIASLGKFLFNAFLGFTPTITGVISKFMDLSRHLADLGFQARSLGVSAKEVSRLGEVAELMGGNFDDAASTVEGLQQALYNLKFNGQMSDQLIQLQRFGVGYMDGAGHMLDTEVIARNAAARLDALKKSGTMSQADAYFAAQSMGFQGGIARAVAGGKGAPSLEKALKEATVDQKQLTQKTIDSQMQLYDANVRLRTTMDTVLSRALGDLSKVLIDANVWLAQLISKWLPKLIELLEAGTKKAFSWIGETPGWIKAIEDFFKGFSEAFFPRLGAAFDGLKSFLFAAQSVIMTVVSWLGKHIPGMGSIASWFQKEWENLRSINAGDLGRAVGYGAQAGLFGGAAESPQDTFISKLGDWMRPKQALPTPLALRPPASGGASTPAAAPPTAANMPNVQIDNMHIYTQANDASAFGDAGDAIRRRMYPALAGGALV